MSGYLGLITLRRGDYLLANSLLKQSLIIYKELEDKYGTACALEGLGSLAVAREEFERTALLWGVDEALREASSNPISLSEHTRHKQQLAQARIAMGEPAFDAAWAQGRAMTWDEAIKFALEAE